MLHWSPAQLDSRHFKGRTHLAELSTEVVSSSKQTDTLIKTQIRAVSQWKSFSSEIFGDDSAELVVDIP